MMWAMCSWKTVPSTRMLLLLIWLTKEALTNASLVICGMLIHQHFSVLGPPLSPCFFCNANVHFCDGTSTHAILLKAFLLKRGVTRKYICISEINYFSKS